MEIEAIEAAITELRSGDSEAPLLKRINRLPEPFLSSLGNDLWNAVVCARSRR
jgi:hypothetical protein